jgi:hypothetical protein
MTGPSEAAVPVSRFLPLSMAIAFAEVRPEEVSLAAQAGAHMRNAGKISP